MMLLFRKFANRSGLTFDKDTDTYQCTSEELQEFANMVIQESLDSIRKTIKQSIPYDHHSALLRIAIEKYNTGEFNSRNESKVDTFMQTTEPSIQMAFIDGMETAAIEMFEHFEYLEDDTWENDSDQDDEEDDWDEDDDDGLSLDEINEIWGVDFSDPDLDVDDIAGDR